jgi:hypothetical protein
VCVCVLWQVECICSPKIFFPFLIPLFVYLTFSPLSLLITHTCTRIGMDSFAAFEEVLYLAKRFRCDMVLLAGDLFHENRPSRRTIYKTMEIIRRYCLGPGAVRLRLVSDPQQTFKDGLVNYLDPNVAVDLPIFSIHGNHDDPTRDGGDLLAALDLLSMSNMVNYFGTYISYYCTPVWDWFFLQYNTLCMFLPFPLYHLPIQYLTQHTCTYSHTLYIYIHSNTRRMSRTSG